MVNETAKINVQLNSQSAENELKGLQKEWKRMYDLKRKAEKAGDVDGWKKIDQQMKKNVKTQKQLENNYAAIENTLNNINGSSIKDLEKANRVLLKRVKELDRNSKEWKTEMGNLGKIKKELRKVKTEMGQIQSPMQKAIGFAKGLFPAFGFAAIIGGAIKAAKALFNLYNETAKARREAERLTGLTGKSLADFTANIQATSKTFNEDFSETLVATNNFAKTMGITVDEALAKINDGFLTGADSSGEFLDILKEYGPQFKAAGLSADESIALISQQVKTGIYSDKGVDAIKEAALSLREMTPAAKSAIDNIGISSNTLQQQLRNGTISIFDAIRMISNRLAELPPQSSKVGTAIADIFKGAGEDAGLEYIKMLGTAELSLDKLKEGAGENAIAQEKLLQANQKLSQAWSELMGTGTDSFTAIKAFAIDLAAQGIAKVAEGIEGVRDWFIALYNESLPVRAYFHSMLAGWQMGFTVVKTALQALWEQLKLGGKLIKAVLTFDVSGIKNAFLDYGENMKNAVVNNAKKIAETWKNAYDGAINGKITPIKQRTENEITTNQITNTAENETVKANNKRSVGGVLNPAESIDPRIEVEKKFSDTVLEQSKLRQKILNNEQQAATDRAAQDLQMQADRRAAYLSTLDTIINVFGQESKIGKAALLAKQAYAIAETIINIAAGTGKTAASVPFPLNIPLIIGFVGQVAGLIGTIKSATGKVKGYATGGFTGGAEMYVAGEAGTEWIAPNWMTKDKVTAPIISRLELYRKTPMNIDLPAILEGISFSRGGYTGTSKTSNSNSVIQNSSASSSSQNETLPELIDRVGRSLDENTAATDRLMKWRPAVAVETYEKHRNQYYDIKKHSGL